MKTYVWSVAVLISVLGVLGCSQSEPVRQAATPYEGSSDQPDAAAPDSQDSTDPVEVVEDPRETESSASAVVEDTPSTTAADPERHTVARPALFPNEESPQGVDGEDQSGDSAEVTTETSTPGEATPANSQEPESNERSDADSPDSPVSSDQAASAESDDLEVSIKEVQRELQEAQDKLTGFINQKRKRDFAMQMQDKLHEVQPDVQQLEAKTADIEDELEEKDDRLVRILQQRKLVREKLSQLDATSADPQEELKKEIEQAWAELQRLTNGSDGKQASEEQ